MVVEVVEVVVVVVVEVLEMQVTWQEHRQTQPSINHRRLALPL
jgi:hypothetical protein